MTATRLYHIGITVRDIDKAIARFSEVLGLTFADPHTSVVDVCMNGVVSRQSLKVTYSQEGPPFIELIEADSDSLWGQEQALGLHHIGSWQEHLHRRALEFEECGLCVEATITSDDELLAIYLDPRSLLGTRVELVNREVMGPRSGLL